MPGTRRDKFFRPGIIFRRLHRKNLFPIRPVAILDSQGNRSADGFSVAHAGKNLRLVFLDFLSPPAAVAELPAVQLVIDELHINGQLRGQAGNKRQQRLPVRFAGGAKFQHCR